MPLDPIVVLDIGTSRIRALVAEENADGQSPGVLTITGYGEYPSAGIRKGACVHMDSAAAQIRSAINDASDAARVTTRSVHLPLTGVGIDSCINPVGLKINGEILQWGEAYKRMRDILSGKEICAPIRLTTETQDTLPLELRTTWVNRALMEKNNAECEKRAVDYWNKRCPGTY